MECKDISNVTVSNPSVIGIYPEWNVKFNSYKVTSNCYAIGIYPEWNVKWYVFDREGRMIKLEYIQNGM